jgi:SnoaL-like domain
VDLTLADRSEITELLSLYGLLLDEQQIGEWSKLFANGAVLEIEGRPPLSTEEERIELARTAPRGTHLSAPPVISEGALGGTAHARQTYLFRDRIEDRMLAGFYEDSLAKVNGRWRFAHRTIRFHQNAERSD